jgi:hypothetical protein
MSAGHQYHNGGHGKSGNDSEQKNHTMSKFQKIIIADDFSGYSKNLTMHGKSDPGYMGTSTMKNMKKHTEFKDKLENIIKSDQKLSNMFLMKDVFKEKRFSATNGKIERKTIVSPSNKYVITKKTGVGPQENPENVYEVS